MRLSSASRASTVPADRGRADSVVRDMNHAFEMLMKGAIVERNGRIREPSSGETPLVSTPAFAEASSDATVRFLSDEQALTIQMLNAQRDAFEHYLVEISEQQLYVHAQAGLTLFADLLFDVFRERLSDHLPERVLPLSTSPPRDLAILVSNEVELIRSLVAPGNRRRVEARAHAKSLAIMEASIGGEFVQPGDAELDSVLDQIGQGVDWQKILPGVASLELDVGGGGIPYSLRIVKKEGIPIHLVSEGTPGAGVVAIKAVDKLGYYNMGMRKLAKHYPGLSEARIGAIITELKIRDDPDCYAEFSIDSQHYKRFSQRAIDRINDELPKLDLDDVWDRHKPRRRGTG